MEFQKGERVVVRTSDNQVKERRVWEDVGRGVLICTDAAFAKAELQGLEPITVGFPREDVQSAQL